MSDPKRGTKQMHRSRSGTPMNERGVESPRRGGISMRRRMHGEHGHISHSEEQSDRNPIRSTTCSVLANQVGNPLNVRAAPPPIRPRMLQKAVDPSPGKPSPTA